jgi:hypothetical protein
VRLVGRVSPDGGGWVDEWMIIFGDIASERCVWFHCCRRELPSIGDPFRRFLRENRVAVETVLSFGNQCLPKRIFGVTASCTSAISCTNARQCSWTETVLPILRSHCTAHHFTPAQHFTPALPRQCKLAERAVVQRCRVGQRHRRQGPVISISKSRCRIVMNGWCEATPEERFGGLGASKDSKFPGI